MFPALPRYDECERGMVEHACRIVVGRSRKEYLYPATHFASTNSAAQTNLPAMGQRVRLKSSYVIPSNFSKEERAILLGLKKYGAIVADNGHFFSVSVTPDDRWPANAFNNIASVGITNFEVVQSTKATEGPRSPGAPSAAAGPDQTVSFGSPVALQGFVNYTGSPPVIQWKTYSGPGTVSLATPSQTNTTATFSTPGTYTLLLSASDGVHAVAYDAVIINVVSVISLAIAIDGPSVLLSWKGGSPPYVLERADAPSGSTWTSLLTTNGLGASVPFASFGGYFRVRGQ
jgi:hypothetical protein